jgi:nucleoid-associated protein YgaU
VPAVESPPVAEPPQQQALAPAETLPTPEASPPGNVAPPEPPPASVAEAPAESAAPEEPAPAESKPPEAEIAAVPQGAHVVVPELDTVTVKRGDNLWKISKRVYGKGAQYRVIYKANLDRIRRPRWIYPGQVFVLPPREVVNEG